MTGTVDIQELNGRARWLKDYGVKTMICDPDTILALIEVAEAAKALADFEAMPLGHKRADAMASGFGRLRAALKETTDV